jgi:integral membrane protein (TIGR01906 family)
VDSKLSDSLHRLVSFNLLVLLLLSVWITLLFGYYYFAPHSSQQSEIFTYLLNQKNNDLFNVNYLNIAEKRHLLDVKRLFINTVQVFQYSILSCFILWLLFHNRLSSSPLRNRVLTMGFIFIIIAIVLNSIFGFNALFASLHHPFFIENTWLFSKESALIQHFPREYFYQFALIYVAIVSTILFLIKTFPLSRNLRVL